ncbi:hypothetical protein LXL04_026771 [Taraxacum kok-saghyz]
MDLNGFLERMGSTIAVRGTDGCTDQQFSYLFVMVFEVYDRGKDMITKTARSFSVKKDTSVFKRLENRNQENIARSHHQSKSQNLVCKYWREGRCTRNPCKFKHPDEENCKPKNVWKNPDAFKSRHSPPIEKTQAKVVKNKENNFNLNQNVENTQKKSLTNEVKNSESKNIQNKNIKNLHLGSCGDEISMVTCLEGQTKGITGIALPAGSNKLFCGSKDKSLRVWDCNSGQCGGVVDFDDECGTLVNESQWIFVGLRNMIKGWNLNTQDEVIIRGSGGQVNAITMFEDILFAGMEDGTILSWKSTSETSFCEIPSSLKGHTGSILSLVIGAKKLFSGSCDNTIRVWDCESLECMHVLNGHTDDVTTLLCWDQYLLSGSLDKKIKVWGANENNSIEEVYQHNVNDGVVAFCGMHDLKGNPILLCSSKDNGVCLYDLPSFMERGRVVSQGDIQAIERGPEGMFFTGDAKGLISVWKLNGGSMCKS